MRVAPTEAAQEVSPIAAGERKNIGIDITAPRF